MTRFPTGPDGQRTAGKGLGILLGSLGVLVALGMLFVPVTWAVGSGAVESLSGIEYLLGNATAEAVFLQALFVLLFSIAILHLVATEGVRTLWLTTGIVGIAGLGTLQHGGNLGKTLCAVAALLALSTALLTRGRGPEW